MTGIWIDSDMGADDIFAIEMVRRRRSIEGVSLSFGVAGLKQVCRNAAGAASALGWAFPIFAGAARSIGGEAISAEAVLGSTGIRTRGAGLPPSANPVASGAVEKLSAWISTRSGAEILALGPLANLAELASAPDRPLSRVARITWMGGGLTTGNHTRYAEFNAAADPEALATLLDSGVRLRMIDLDACRKVLAHETDLAALEGIRGERAALFRDLLGGYLDIAHERGRPGMPLYDPVAAAALLDPGLFAFAEAHIRVELADASKRGQTVAIADSGSVANAEIAAEVDAEGVRRLLFEALGAPA